MWRVLRAAIVVVIFTLASYLLIFLGTNGIELIAPAHGPVLLYFIEWFPGILPSAALLNGFFVCLIWVIAVHRVRTGILALLLFV